MNPIHLGILAFQVVIALVSLAVSWHWYIGAARRGEVALATQQHDLAIKVRKDFSEIAAGMTDVFGRVTISFFSGTKAYTNALRTTLQELQPELEKIRNQVHGADIEAGTLQIRILEIEEQVAEYLQTDEHDVRVRLCGSIETKIEDAKNLWKQACDEQIVRLKPPNDGRGT